MSLALLLALMTHARAPVKPVPPLKARFASFPRIDQLHERLPDGHASENAGMNCIPTSIAAGLEFLTGKSFSGDAVKEALHG